jgi:hypothetical protein
MEEAAKSVVSGRAVMIITTMWSIYGVLQQMDAWWEGLRPALSIVYVKETFSTLELPRKSALSPLPVGTIRERNRLKIMLSWMLMGQLVW